MIAVTEKAVVVGVVTSPAGVIVASVDAVSTMPTTAVDNDVPTARIRAFTPFASPVCVAGTTDMISAGIAEYAMPRPAPTSALAESIHHHVTGHGPTSTVRNTTYPAPITTAPDASDTRAPRRLVSAALTYEKQNITRPAGIKTRLARTIDMPSPDGIEAGAINS